MDRSEKRRLIDDFAGRRAWAVVGASRDPNKFGNRIFRTMRACGYEVFPVNPKGGNLDGARVYARLADLPQLPEVVNLVVPPPVTEIVVREAHSLGLTRIWMQPGAESEPAIEYCRAHGMDVIHDACAMVHARRWA